MWRKRFYNRAIFCFSSRFKFHWHDKRNYNFRIQNVFKHFKTRLRVFGGCSLFVDAHRVCKIAVRTFGFRRLLFAITPRTVVLVDSSQRKNVITKIYGRGLCQVPRRLFAVWSGHQLFSFLLTLHHEHYIFRCNHCGILIMDKFTFTLN